MSISAFETSDANYYLGLAAHKWSSYPLFREEGVDFSEIDAIVFEELFEAQNPPAVYLQNRLETSEQYRELYRHATSENPDIAVYGVDVHPSALLEVVGVSLQTLFSILGLYYAPKAAIEMIEKRNAITRRDFLKGSIVACLGTLQGSVVLAGANEALGNPVPAVRELNSARSNILSGPIDGFRDAVAAKKITEYIIPKHNSGGKPNVAIVYGLEHSGIELKLQHPAIYEGTIFLYHDLFGYGTRDELNQVREIVKTKRGLQTIYHDAALF